MRQLILTLALLTVGINAHAESAADESMDRRVENRLHLREELRPHRKPVREEHAPEALGRSFDSDALESPTERLPSRIKITHEYFYENFQGE